MPLRKAVIPAAGFGTRMLPAAKAVPKELLPVVGKPVVQYVVEECAAAGAGQVVLVTSRDKPALEAHFHHHDKLEARLRKAGKADLLAGLDALIDRVTVTPAYQDEALGLGHAVLQAERAVGDEPFLCLLGDTIFSGGDALPAVQLARAYDRYGTAVIGLELVPEDRVSRYGIVGGTAVEPGVLRLDTLVEKPDPAAAPSRYAVAARYVLTPGVFAALRDTPPGKGGEVQLTDALRILLAREPIHGVVLTARRHDIGNPVDWLRTNLVLAARDDRLWAELRPTVERLLQARDV